MKNKTRRKTSPIWLCSPERFKQIINTSDTIGEVLSYFGLRNIGGNYNTLTRRLKEENIDYYKFKINARKGQIKKFIPIQEMLIENSPHSRSNLKKRLIEENILKEICEKCKMGPTWQNERLSLHLDHKNGISNDNRIGNLRFLCPNCHSQTDTFAGKKNKKNKYCISCNKTIHKKSIHCNKCNVKQSHQIFLSRRKFIHPSKEELFKLIWDKPTILIAKDYGVSDKAIEKITKKYQLKKPPRGYWQKSKQEQEKTKKELLEKDSNFY